MKENKLPKTEITFQLFGKERNIDLSNTGKLIDVTKRLSYNSDGKHNLLLLAKSRESIYVYYLLEGIAYVDSFLPEIKKELGLKNLSDMDLLQTKELVECYVDHIMKPKDEVYNFFYETNNELANKDEESEEE